MNKKKLKKIENLIRSLRDRSANIRRRQLVNIAKKLGREQFNRGKEPTFVSNVFKELRPISIPSHPGAMKRFTAESILDQLENDLVHWMQSLESNPNSLTNNE